MRRIEPILIALLAAFFRAYRWTWRVRHLRFPEEAQQQGPLVFGHWHGDELLLIGAYTGTGMAAMASLSRDGERQRRLLGWLGYNVVRGSSSRGGVAGLKALIGTVAEKKVNASLAVDGPRGPIYQLKPGILKLAQATERPLVLGAAAAGRAYRFSKAWNKAYLPKAFSRCVVIYSEPLWVPRDLDDAALEQLRLRLEQQLISLKVEAEKTVGHFVPDVPETSHDRARLLAIHGV